MAYGDDVATIEHLAIDDVGAVQFGSIFAAEVLYPEMTLLESDERMLFRGVHVIDADLALGIAPDAHASVVERERAPIVKGDQN